MFPSEYCETFKNKYFEEHLLTAAFDFFKTATEQWWAATSVLTLLLSSGNLSTAYQLLSINNLIEIYQFVSLAKHWFMFHIKFNRDMAKNWFMWNKKFVYVLNYLKIFKAVPKNNPRTHSPLQNKKAVLTTDACFKFCTPTRFQRHNRTLFTFVNQKGCFRSKKEKVNTTIEFCLFELV